MHAYIGLGSNLGDRLGTLGRAAARLAELGALLRRSAIYETAPLGPPQPDYLNAALLLDTALSPTALLAALLGIEADQGRRREPAQRYGPRTLDLDVLLLGEGGQLVLRDPGPPPLLVPHPRLHERAFALWPLCDLDRSLRHPVLGAPLQALAEGLLGAGEAPPRLLLAGPWP